jgi:hypothetical protein
VTAPAEGPVTVTLTDDERWDISEAPADDLRYIVERIVAARVAALTADLAAAREDADRWERDAAEWDTRAAEADQVIANVRALADQWLADRLAYPLDDPRASVAFIAVKACEEELRALLPAAPTGEGTDD